MENRYFVVGSLKLGFKVSALGDSYVWTEGEKWARDSYRDADHLISVWSVGGAKFGIREVTREQFWAWIAAQVKNGRY